MATTSTSTATIRVSTRSELEQALSSATGGEKIILANGDYGTLNIANKSYSDYVTIEAENPLGAQFETVSVTNSNYIRIDGVHVDNPGNGGTTTPIVSITNGSHHVDFVNSEVNGKEDGTYSGFYGIYTKDASNVTIENNYVHDVKNGGVFYNSTDLNVLENTINYIGEDSFKFIGVQGVLIENNTGATHVYRSSSAHCDFIQFQGQNSSDIVIRGNVQLPGNGASATAQGIFMDDAHYTNVLIEQNIIVTGMIRGVSVSSGTNVVARENTVLDVTGMGSKATKVLVDGQSYDNIFGTYAGDKSLGEGQNLGLQGTDPSKGWYSGKYFENAEKGLGITLEDLRPIAGTTAEQYGAYDRIMELLDGEPPADNTDDQPADPPSDPPADPPADPPNDDETDTGNGNTYPDAGGTDDTADTGEPIDLDDLMFTDTVTISAAKDVIEIAPNSGLALGSGTIAFSFEANSTAGTLGLVSRDASGYVGDGNHFAVYIKDGALMVRFQDGDSDTILTADGITANQSYDVQIDFDGKNVNLLLDGEVAASGTSNMTWETNNEFLQVGALGWASGTGEAGFRSVFNGTISDFIITEGVLTTDEIAEILNPSVDVPVYSMIGVQDIASADDVIEIAPQGGLALASGTIAFSFSANDVTSVSGLVSKDASGYAGGGNHFAAYIEKGIMKVRFQDGDSDSILKVTGIQANETYDVQFDFNGELVHVYLNGNLAGTAESSMTWETNNEFLQFGGLGWASQTGEAGFGRVLDGSISNIAVVEGVLTPDEMAEVIAAAGYTPPPPPVFDTAFNMTGSQMIEGPEDVIELAPSASFEMASGTVAMTFEANSIDGVHGLVSKDAGSYTGGGNHFAAYIQDGTLKVRFQDGASDAIIEVPGIEANKAYQVQFDFDGQTVNVTFDGVIVGSAESSMTWETNKEFIQFGALGWASATGKSGFDKVFDGAISDIVVAEGTLSQEEVAEILASTMNASGSDDLMIGTAEADVFVFADGYGNDTVRGFDADNAEKVDLAGLSDVESFADMMDNHISQTDEGVLISTTEDTLLLDGLSLADFGIDAAYSADDFIF